MSEEDEAVLTHPHILLDSPAAVVWSTGLVELNEHLAITVFAQRKVDESSKGGRDYPPDVTARISRTDIEEVIDLWRGSQSGADPHMVTRVEPVALAPGKYSLNLEVNGTIYTCSSSQSFAKA